MKAEASRRLFSRARRACPTRTSGKLTCHHPRRTRSTATRRRDCAKAFCYVEQGRDVCGLGRAFADGMDGEYSNVKYHLSDD
jgi:hypothetical protein